MGNHIPKLGELCLNCGGTVETLGPGRRGVIKRCRSCGFEPQEQKTLGTHAVPSAIVLGPHAGAEFVPTEEPGSPVTVRPAEPSVRKAASAPAAPVGTKAGSLAGTTSTEPSCAVTGCPGTLDAAGQCACCARREAWAEAHIPKRKCGVCHGLISGHLKIKYCAACRPIVLKSQIANAPSTAARKQAAA